MSRTLALPALLAAVCLTTTLAPSAALAQGGTIVGTVTIQSEVNRPEMKHGGPADVSAETYKGTGAGGGDLTFAGAASEAENVVVYLATSPGDGPYTPPAANPKLVQHKKRLIPHVLPVLVGTTVEFPNKDNFNHNVFSLSKVKKFDLGLYKSGKTKFVTFDKPGQVKVYCNIHSQMRAIIQVLPNPYFAKPGANGGYQIPRVPPGRYELMVWHEKFPGDMREITVEAGRVTQVDFTLK